MTEADKQQIALLVAIQAAGGGGGGGGQPLDDDLTAIAGLSPANDDVIQRKSGAWTNRTIAQLKTDLSLQPLDADLTSWAAITRGTGFDAAAAINVGSSGAVVVNGGTAGTTTTVDGTNLVGFRGVPNNSQTAAYSTVLADAGKCIFHPSSDNNARTFTIDGSVAYVVGTVIEFINLAAASCTIAIGTDTLTFLPAGTTGSRTLAQYGRANAEKVASGTWIISGNSALT